jgi:O-antigen/teichoic acid export membrane protein
MIDQNRMWLNSATGLMRYVIVSLLYFLILPFVLKNLGVEMFGVWSLLTIVTNYARIVDFGISTAIVKLVAQASISESNQSLGRLISSAISLLLIIGAVLATLLIVFRGWVTASLMNIPFAFHKEASLALAIGAIALIFVLLGQTLSATLDAAQHMEYSNGILVITSLLNTFGVLVAIILRTGLVGLMVNNAITALIGCILAFIFFKKLYPDVLLSIKSMNLLDIEKVLKLGVIIQLAGIFSMVAEPTFKLLISHNISIASVSYFELGIRLTTIIRSLFTAALAVLLPVTAVGQVVGRDYLKNLYNKIMRYLFIASTPAFALLFSLASPIVFVWLGLGYEAVSGLMKSLLPPIFLSLISLPSYIMAQGSGNEKLSTVTMMINVFLAVAIATITMPGMQLNGFVLAYWISNIFAAIFLLITFHRKLGLQWHEWIAPSYVHVLIINIIFFILINLVVKYLSLSNIVLITLFIVLSLTFYGIIIWNSHAIGKTEKQQILLLLRMSWAKILAITVLSDHK